MPRDAGIFSLPRGAVSKGASFVDAAATVDNYQPVDAIGYACAGIAEYAALCPRRHWERECNCRLRQRTERHSGNWNGRQPMRCPLLAAH